jgi:hypothetical protein
MARWTSVAAEFMRGEVGTRTGHPVPVIVTCDRAPPMVRANAWISSGRWPRVRTASCCATLKARKPPRSWSGSRYPFAPVVPAQTRLAAMAVRACLKIWGLTQPNISAGEPWPPILTVRSSWA